MLSAFLDSNSPSLKRKSLSVIQCYSIEESIKVIKYILRYIGMLVLSRILPNWKVRKNLVHGF